MDFLEEKRTTSTMMALLTRKEASIAWKDTSLKPLFGYGSALYFVEQIATHPSSLLKTRLQVSTNDPPPSPMLCDRNLHMEDGGVKAQAMPGNHLLFLRWFGPCLRAFSKMLLPWWG